MLTTTLVLAGLILIAAVLYSSVGHAGASGYLAAMAFLNVPPEVMRPTALVLNLLVATLATYRFARAGHFSHSLLWPFAVGSVPLAFIGGGLQLPGHWYKTLVGLVLLLAAVRLVQEHRITCRPMSLDCSSKCRCLSLSAQGPSSVGSPALRKPAVGSFSVPCSCHGGWAETPEPGGLSAAFILINSAAALAGNIVSVHALPAALPLWAGAAMIGGLVGSELGARRIATGMFRLLLALVLVVAGGKLILT